MISRAVTLAAYVLMSRREAGSDAISSTAGIATTFRRFTARGLAAIWVSMFADDRLRREGTSVSPRSCELVSPETYINSAIARPGLTRLSPGDTTDVSSHEHPLLAAAIRVHDPDSGQLAIPDRECNLVSIR